GGEGGGMRGEKGPRRATPTDLGPARKGRTPAPACSSGRSCTARGRPTPRSRHGAEVLGLRHQGGTMRAKAIRIHETGGAETLRWDEIEIAPPGSGEVLVRHTAVGVNYIDVYHRTGLYPVPGPPGGLGGEAAGVVEAIGRGVPPVKTGERVPCGGGPRGASAEPARGRADRLVPLPASISDEQAAAMMLKGLTAHY